MDEHEVYLQEREELENELVEVEQELEEKQIDLENTGYQIDCIDVEIRKLIAEYGEDGIEMAYELYPELMEELKI